MSSVRSWVRLAAASTRAVWRQISLMDVNPSNRSCRATTEPVRPFSHVLLPAGRYDEVAIVEFLRPNTAFEPNLRQQRALDLPELGLGRPPVGGRFPDARVRLDCLQDGIPNGEHLCGDGYACCAQEYYRAPARERIEAPGR